MGHKILLADDSITIQKVIELTFSDEDFELHTVGNGQKAIDEIRTIMPHIVLCDIIMPEKNGYEVCEFIKTNADLKHIPVLLLTGAFEPFDQERARNAGCDGFLAKPFEPQTLISKVKELLARVPAAAPPAAPPPVAARPRPVAQAAPPRAPGMPSMPGMPQMDERTVLVPPSSLGASPAPPRGPQVTAATPPPPAPVADFGTGLDEGFAVEAGERELMMDPGDHTVLLGGRESAPAAPPTPSDDIWGEVVPSPPSEEEADSATVFMAPPHLAQSPAGQPPPTSPSYDEIQYDVEDLDATWRMSGPESGAASTSDYAGFEEFAEPPPADTMAASAAPVPPVPVFSDAEPGPVLEMPPPLTPSQPATPAPVEPIEPIEYQAHDPFTAAAGGAHMAGTAGTASRASRGSPSGFDAVHPFDSDVTLDSAVTDESFEPVGASDFEAYQEPGAASAPPPETPSSGSNAWRDEPVFTPAAAADAFDEVEAGMPAMASMDAMDEYEPASFESKAPPSGNSSVSIDDALIEKLAQRVVDKLSSKVIQEIAWEVVPDLAEGLIRKEIEALKAKIPK
jgi:CheY-like chemotaxis protein